MWAALIARLNYINGGKPLGFINPLLYKHPEVFRKINQGSNGQYFAHPYYDPCTGLGVPTHRIVEIIKHPRCPKSELKPYHYKLPDHLIPKKEAVEHVYHTLLGESYRAPEGAHKVNSFTAEEIAQEQVSITLIFKEIVTADVRESVEAWARAEGLAFQGDVGPFACHVEGSALALCKALGLSGFDHWKIGNVRYRYPANDVTLPENRYWTSHLSTIIGLDTEPVRCTSLMQKQAAPQYRSKKLALDQVPYPVPGVTSGDWQSGGYFPFSIARMYSFPTVGFGKGQSVGIIALAGGYSIYDLNFYWSYMGIARPPTIAMWKGILGG